MIIAYLQKWALKVLIAVALLLGIGLYSYHAGVQHEKGIEAAKVIKADNQIVKKNDTLQAAADASASQTIVYRDRIVTKYKTIKQDVVHYAQTNPNASNLLDPDFVRLHDLAASANGEDTIAGSAGRTTADSGATGVVTKADALRVITGNYKRFYLCRQQGIDWNDCYTNVKTKVNGPDSE